MGFERMSISHLKIFNEELIEKYTKRRDYPRLEGTSRLGVHLRFGTVSIGELVRTSDRIE